MKTFRIYEKNFNTNTVEEVMVIDAKRLVRDDYTFQFLDNSDNIVGVVQNPFMIKADVTAYDPEQEPYIEADI